MANQRTKYANNGDRNRLFSHHITDLKRGKINKKFPVSSLTTQYRKKVKSYYINDNIQSERQLNSH